MALTEPLDEVEARILGVLVEKEFTTPENYPLSLNALLSGCNQKSNRDPVVGYTEQTVQEALLRLRLHRIVREMHTAGARVAKFAHSAREVLEVDDQELGLIAELLLRGPQTHGELRGHVKRMAPVDSLPELAVILSRLESRGMVCSLPPAPGSRASRVGHLLGEDRSGAAASQAPAEARADGPAPAPAAATTTVKVAATSHDVTDRVAALEAQLARLERRLEALEKGVGGGGA